MRPRSGVALATILALAAAATSVHGLFRGWGWYWPVVGGTALAVVSGLATRRLRVPLPGRVLVALAVLVEYAVLLDARRYAPLGFVPTGRALSLLGDHVQLAVREMRVYVVPVASRPEFTLVLVAAVFLLSILVDELVAARRPALAGLPLLLLLAVPAGIHGTHVGGWSFTASAGSWLLLLVVERRDRLPHQPREDRTGDRTTEIAWRVGGAALAAALILPAVVPALHHNFLVSGYGGSGRGHGGSNIVTVVPPLVTVDEELHERSTIPLLRVQTAEPDYLRLTALERFDGTSFTLGPISAPSSQQVDHPLPTPPRRVAVIPDWVQVSASKSFDESYLALPYAPTAVRVSGDWRLDIPTTTVFSTSSTTQGLTYDATAELADPTPAQIAATGPAAPEQNLTPQLAADEALPAYERGFLHRIAVAETRGARTAFAEALDLQDYLRSAPFVYDLQTGPLAGPGALEEFLTVTHAGFCQQFATAMAALARSLGLPARVAVGFTPGSRIGRDTYLVTNHDAHAWPEIYFPGTGWLRFEPTPTSDGGADTPAYAQPPSSSGRGQSGGRGRTHTHPRGPLSRRHPAQRFATQHGGSPTGAPHPRAVGHGSGFAAWPVIPALVVLLLLLPGATRLLLRRRRLVRVRAGGPAAAEAAWAELLESAHDLEVAVPPSCSPKGAGRVLLAASGGGVAVEAALDRLVRALEQARYAGPALDARMSLDPGALALLRRRLAARSSRETRLRAALLPPSALRALAVPVSRALANALDAVDAGGTWVMARLRPRRSRTGRAGGLAAG